MADALRAVPLGLEAVRLVLPETFNWPLFLVALALMAAPVAALMWAPDHDSQRRRWFPRSRAAGDTAR